MVVFRQFLTPIDPSKKPKGEKQKEISKLF